MLRPAFSPLWGSPIPRCTHSQPLLPKSRLLPPFLFLSTGTKTALLTPSLHLLLPQRNISAIFIPPNPKHKHKRDHIDEYERKMEELYNHHHYDQLTDYFKAIIKPQSRTNLSINSLRYIMRSFVQIGDVMNATRIVRYLYGLKLPAEQVAKELMDVGIISADKTEKTDSAVQSDVEKKEKMPCNLLSSHFSIASHTLTCHSQKGMC